MPGIWVCFIDSEETQGKDCDDVYDAGGPLFKLEEYVFLRIAEWIIQHWHGEIRLSKTYGAFDVIFVQTSGA